MVYVFHEQAKIFQMLWREKNDEKEAGNAENYAKRLPAPSPGTDVFPRQQEIQDSP